MTTEGLVTMRKHIPRLALLGLAFSAPVSIAHGQSSQGPRSMGRVTSSQVVGRLLEQGVQLGLTASQESALRSLAADLHQERGRLVIAGWDRVPGRSVPRVTRVRRTSAQALHETLSVLTPEQQAVALRVLASTVADPTRG